ncbi:Bis(5'-nucleosyl)-tetraphosphatase PrpE [Anaerotignum neopropionicum]|uniref:Bis(5'-nucleosyl)-tetraphosphatase PrpE n=1 Tax=Anaerotignum neopropionicum TaxID=36847 RepID=A0A136WI36_9FIRM|nr:metallophosphoesterase [Anaerotignum neopropionicum]KXL54019.1 Bis(5'-nucleosyl)-tetraphosphatase PrpE [Anaerotignum neopropionicum]
MREQRERNFRILEFKENKFDIIGDVHGCYDELMELVQKLGYEKKGQAYVHPQGRRLISVGDVADKGPKNLAALEFWMDQVIYGGSFWVHGNHCNKLYRFFLGNKVRMSHGLENTIEELEKRSKEERVAFRNRFMSCYKSQCYYLLLDKRRLAVVHGGLREESMGRFSNKIRAVCLYGETAGVFEKNEKPIRLDWAEEYRGKAFVVYGHTVQEKPNIVHNTVDIDQGCVYGGYLTALRYPEREFVQVRGKAYAEYLGSGKVPE